MWYSLEAPYCAASTEYQQICFCGAIWSESKLGEFRIASDGNFLNADNEDSDHAARKHRLIWVFVGRTCQKVRFLTLRLIYIQLIRVFVQHNMGCLHSKSEPLENKNDGDTDLDAVTITTATDSRLPLDTRQVFKLKKSWKGVRRKIEEAGIEMFVR